MVGGSVVVHPEASHHDPWSVWVRMRAFWEQDHLCDVTLKTDGGTEHRCHRLVLSAASSALQNLLGGRFQEGQQLQHGEPVAICASSCAIGTMLDYIYGGEPEVADKDLMELLRLAGAYELPKLAQAIEAEFHSSLCSATAVRLLPQICDLNLHDLTKACEETIAADFENCAQDLDFITLNGAQLGRILQRDDLVVSREETVLEALFKWVNAFDDRKTYLALLLAHVDLPSVAEDNLKRLCLYAQSMGSGGSDVQFAVQTALRRQKKRKSDGSVEMYQPKRLCLGSWSPVLGGHSCSPKRLVKISEVLPDQFCKKLCLHDGAFYVSDPYNRRVLRIKPGEGDTQIVAGNGAPVNGFNDLSLDFDMVVSPTGDLFAMEGENENNLLVKFSHGFGEVLHENCPRIDDLFCSPNGVLYMLDLAGKRVQKFEGSRLKPVWSRDEHHDSLDWFEGDCICVTRDEVLYICGWCYDDDWQSRVQLLRFQPGSSKSTIVATGDWQAETCRFNLVDLCVTDDDRVFFLNPDLGICAMSLQETAVQDLGVNVASGLTVESLVVQGGSLYVVAIDLDGLGRDGIYEFELPRSLEVSSS